MVLVVKLNALLEKYESKIDPLLEKADAVLTTTSEKVSSIGTKAEVILTQGEELTEMVHSRVDTTTLAVHRTVFTPLIGVNSLIAGVRRGAETFAKRQQKTMTDILPPSSVPSAQTPIQETIPIENTEIQAATNQSVAVAETKKILKVDETSNLSTITSVNNLVSNRAEPQLVVVGSRKEDG